MLDAEVVFRSVPVTAGDRNAGGDIIRPEIIEELQGIVAELDARVTVPQPSDAHRSHSGLARSPLSPSRDNCSGTDHPTTLQRRQPMAIAVQPFEGI